MRPVGNPADLAEKIGSGAIENAENLYRKLYRFALLTPAGAIKNAVFSWVRGFDSHPLPSSVGQSVTVWSPAKAAVVSLGG